MKDSMKANAHCYCIHLRRATSAVTKLYDQELEGTGLTISQFSLLGNIKTLGICSKVELAEYTGLDKSTITRNLKLLRDKGLIKDLSARESRESQLALTDLGLAIHKNAYGRWCAVQEKMEETIGTDKLLELETLLSQLETLSQ